MNYSKFIIETNSDELIMYQIKIPILNGEGKKLDVELICGKTIYTASLADKKIRKTENEIIIFKEAKPGIDTLELRILSERQVVQKKEFEVKIINTTNSNINRLAILAQGFSKTNITKLESLGIEVGVRISVLTDLKTELLDYRIFRGIIVFDQGNYDEFFLKKLFEFVADGGRMFYLLQNNCSLNNELYMKLFNFSVANELIQGTKDYKGKIEIEAENLCSLFSGTAGAQIELYGPYIGNFFRFFKDSSILKTEMLQSAETNKQRCIGFHKKIEMGESWFIADFSCHSGSSSSQLFSSGMFYDSQIDLFENEENALSVISWLNSNNS
jgi:hypothetical protein